MASKEVITSVALAAVLAAWPAAAQDGQRHRDRQQASPRAERSAPAQRAEPQRGQRERPQAQRAEPRERAVPRTSPAPRYEDQRRYEQNRRYDQRRYDQRYDPPRGVGPRVYTPQRNYGREVPYYAPRIYRAPRVIRPSIVTVVPYRPYVYRPSWSLGVYYGADGYYPYGYTPRAYYDPLPGRPYGGLRITDVPRDAQVFADGYYVGIVNDFDGIFQHLNLEAGGHHIEIELPGGYDAPIAFDVYIEPGRTVTYRASY